MKKKKVSMHLLILIFMQEESITAGRAKSYGQALQYTDNIVEVKAGSKLAVVVKRDASEVCFLLNLLYLVSLERSNVAQD